MGKPSCVLLKSLLRDLEDEKNADFIVMYGKRNVHPGAAGASQMGNFIFWPHFTTDHKDDISSYHTYTD